ncbi:Cytosol aminopeptidase [Mycoplasmopsis glycophila]|uniref:Probable cytosol aminopeptidase n=2 Tax=Mycoplasmopsis glycophila TaxID=171285 RepID=A0A449AWK2_9BACT|nr:peptidase M17 [Mycoplasmopsis glycophila]VEU71186.1 Cytosol aminopeptidase [Mycoplasmopsis glycophila]
MKIIKKENQNFVKVIAAYEGSVFPEFVGTKNFTLTEDIEKNIAYFYIDKEHQTIDGLIEAALKLGTYRNRNYQIDLTSFLFKGITIEQLMRIFILKIDFVRAELFKKSIEIKTSKTKSKEMHLLVENLTSAQAKLINKLQLVSDAITKVRNLQIKPENFLNSEMLASEVAHDFSGLSNLRVEVLTKKEIQDLGMNLLLSVNKGSTHEPRVLVAQYQGNPKSKENIVIVGKGITFDTGGVNTKGYHMSGMKFDMSGSAIAAYAVKVLAQLKAKVNVSAVMCITDNRINHDASLPENIYQSMSGKWVEVNDTDAEGRLVLADGLYYGATKLKATTLIDVATLTGTMLTALGHVYTGIWSTDENNWEQFEKASQISLEKVWRMPMHEDFNKGNKSSKVADLLNWSSIVKADSNQAAMFLKEFTNDVKYIHCDVAGTADKNGEPQGELVATLVEYALLSSK